MKPRRSSGSTIVLGVAFAWVATAVPMGPISAADSATIVPLLDELAAAGPLAVSANGQTAYVVDESRRVIVGFDPFDPANRDKWIQAFMDEDAEYKKLSNNVAGQYGRMGAGINY